MKRKRIIYIGLAIIVMILGIASRRYGIYLPNIISKYAGDTLWALMVYLGFGFLFNKSKIRNVALASMTVSYLIEISQLYQGEWINSIRDTTIGALILGHGFLISDLVCYTIGILIGVVFEYLYFYIRHRWSRQKLNESI